MKQSVGILAYRLKESLQVFLVHPGGPFLKIKMKVHGPYQKMNTKLTKNP
jgi:predicted NUDIX family NTP pyrophosphohydrolase